MAYILAFLKYVIYGTSVFFTSELESSTSVLDVLALRFLMSFVFLWLLKITGIIKIKIGVKDFFVKNDRTPFIKSLFLAAMFEPVLYMFFETMGISMTTNITTAVILSLMPIVSCIVEAVILKEKNSLLQKFFLGLGIVGVIYIAVKTDTGSGENSIIGIIFLLLTIISGALFLAFSRKSSSAFAPMEITYISAILGAVIFNAINIVNHIIRGDILHYFDPYFNVDNLIGFVVLGIVSTVIATGMNNYCMSKMQVSTMAAFSGVSTVVTIIVGVIFGNEQLYYYHYIGLSLILIRMIGVSVISIRKERLSLPQTEK
ncbi:MAG: DMT family transporter [Clostridia bacterium]|nr:DMT family transporter [Clostridia bacterium]